MVLLLVSFVISGNKESEVTYDGRTVEDWLYNSEWEKDKGKAEFALFMLGEKAVEPLRAILRLESPSWVISIAWKMPLGQHLLRAPLQNVVKKRRAIECLEALGSLRARLLPEVITIAEDESEFLQNRRIALRYIHQHMPLSSEKSNILARLTADASLPEAAGYFAAVQNRFLEEERKKTIQEIDDRFGASERVEPNIFSPNDTVFEPRLSLWETGR